MAVSPLSPRSHSSDSVVGRNMDRLVLYIRYISRVGRELEQALREERLSKSRSLVVYLMQDDLPHLNEVSAATSSEPAKCFESPTIQSHALVGVIIVEFFLHTGAVCTEEGSSRLALPVGAFRLGDRVSRCGQDRQRSATRLVSLSLVTSTNILSSLLMRSRRLAREDVRVLVEFPFRRNALTPYSGGRQVLSDLSYLPIQVYVMQERLAVAVHAMEIYRRAEITYFRPSTSHGAWAVQRGRIYHYLDPNSRHPSHLITIHGQVKFPRERPFAPRE
ncbi:hypothetical protein EXIGLDRAFT_697198 [Exidia glandulosa HHB12029]|uniref:Uncharacterized protein n=1 Tax=Exidia glandulosa HHB12029 TaxID=1314781 RepID=A0A165EW78_EXIGL|nr:hypothetical protein EXIGLDRAFT_697198 [Exidia glandulosa HHB12029]